VRRGQKAAGLSLKKDGRAAEGKKPMACSAVVFFRARKNEFSGKPKEVMHTMKINLFNRDDPNL
jgi:hypothetical protein